MRYVRPPPAAGTGRPIRRQLLLLVLAVLVPLAALQAWTLIAQARDDLHRASASALAIAEVTAAYSHTVVREAHALLHALARRPQVRAADPDGCDPILGELAALNPRYANVLVAAPDGRVQCSGVPPVQGRALPDASEQRWFHEALAAHGPVVGTPHVGRITGVWVSVQALALRGADGAVLAVIGVPLDLSALRPALGPQDLASDRTVGLVNREGTVIARVPHSDQWVGRDVSAHPLVRTVLREEHGYTRMVGPRGVESVYGFAPVPDTNWYAIASIPSAEVLRPVWQEAWRHGVIALVVLALAVLLALLSARRLARPLQAIGAAARRAGGGDLSTPVPVEGPLELAELALRFNRMLERRAQAEAAQQRLTRILQAVREVQQSYIADAPPEEVFQRLLDAVLELSGSTLGFLGEVLPDDTRGPRVLIRAMRGGGGAVRPAGQRIDAVDALFADVIARGEPLRMEGAGAAASAWTQAYPLPPGHPPIQTLLGLPLHSGGQVVGVIGLANRAAGYGEDLLDELEPLLATCGHLMAAYASEQRRREAEERLAFLSQYDALTALPNRFLLRDRLGLALGRATREQTLLAVLVIDLDHFKQINESLGRETGDAYLCAVAARLRSVSREADTVARLEGDDFAVVVEGMHEVNELADAVQRYQQALGAPVHLEEREVSVTVSIGVSVYPHDAQEPEALLERADTAMMQAKREGRNAYRFYTTAMQVQAAQRVAVESRLRGALERGEMVLHYQPQVDLASGRVVGVEALVRWVSEGRLLLPAQFIPLAEDNGMILPIGEWVLRSACAEAARWRARGMPALTLAVNVSPFQFHHADVPALVESVLADTGLPAAQLELEITEGVLLQEPDATVAALHALRGRGVQLAVDDFGTGYSSLSYLKRLPVHKVKIDSSFVRDLTTDPDDEAIVTAIIAMARNLKLTVVAEGVETPEQLALLRLLKCDQYQGYYYGRPETAAAFEARVRRTASGG